MSLDEYRDIWQGQEPDDEPEDLEEVLSEVKERSEEYDRKLFWRDVREIGASVVVMGLFGWLAFTEEALLARIGAAIVVAWSGLVIWKFRRARRSGEDELAGRPVTERIRAEIEKVGAQIELLESVLWWYIGPMVVGIVVMVAAGGIEGWFEPAFLVGLAAFGAFVWWLNQRAVDNYHRPRREELVRTLRRIENGDAASGSG